MPVRTTKLPSGKVRVSTPGGTKAKATTPAKAAKQKRLLNAIDHGFVPRGSHRMPDGSIMSNSKMRRK